MSQQERPRLWDGEMEQALNTRWAGRGTVDYAPETPSTNTRLKEMLKNGAPKGSLALCDLQTAGRGRMQRPWIVARGEALTLSLLLQPTLAVEQTQLCTLVTALAVAQAIRDAAPGLAPRVKWPNDVVIRGRKCTGILSELMLTEPSAPSVIMGVGINANQRAFPAELEATATSLWLEARKADKAAAPVDLRALLAAFLRREESMIDTLEKDGFTALKPLYRQSSATLGNRVRVVSPDSQFIGLAEDVDDQGALLVRDDAGALRRVLCGDVSVRGLMGYAD